MRPEYYADDSAATPTFLPGYATEQSRPHRQPAPAWTTTTGPAVLMERAGRYIDAITLHHYTVAGAWQPKGSATEFSRGNGKRLRKCLRMDDGSPPPPEQS